MGNWIASNFRCYLGNAISTRDYRVQLRGNRPILLWGLYLVVLIGFTMLFYSNAAGRGESSIVIIQNELKGVYQAIMILLAAVILLVSPALTAGSVVMERQRRSLDLVFSAPVSTKYYLVGKVLSSYRYVWMLLVLALPVTAACVVLGGATWSDVIAAYIILSFNALVYTAIAMLFSTLAQKPVAAVVWSYAATIGYSIITGVVGTATLASSFMGAPTQEALFIGTLNPFPVVQTAPTFTMIGNTEVPNWVLGGIVSILFCKILVLAAASAMSGYGSKETISVRIHGILYAFLVAALSALATGSPTSIGPSGDAFFVDVIFAVTVAPLAILSIFMTCYGDDGERRYWRDGLFRIRMMLVGTPSGALPYILSIIAAAYAGYFCPYSLSSSIFDGPTLAFAFWLTSFMMFMWALGRASSSLTKSLRSARTLHFAFIVLLVILPAPFFAMTSVGGTPSWELYILAPMTGPASYSAAVLYGVLMLIASAFCLYMEARTLAQNKSQLRSAA